MFQIAEKEQNSYDMPFAFPLKIFETHLSDKPNGSNSWHYHEDLQISYVLDGEITVAFQGDSYTLKAGEAIFINSNVSHMTTSVDPKNTRFRTLRFKSSVITLFHGSIIEQKYYLPFRKDPLMQVATFSPDVPGEKLFLDGIQALFSAAEKKEFGYELIVYSILIGLWKFMLDHTGDCSRRARPEENEDARKLLFYLREHYAERITLEELADHVHISRSACCRLFRTTYGCAPFTYLVDFRLQKSIMLLTDESLPISQVAERCGFNSTSYFIKAFRERIGVTPLQYRLTYQ